METDEPAAGDLGTAPVREPDPAQNRDARTWLMAAKEAFPKREALDGSCREGVSPTGAVAAANLNNDPARPLQYLSLQGIVPPLAADQYTRAERDVLLYDGIATWIVDTGGNVLIERCKGSMSASIEPENVDGET